tara:strand:+ start:723 stop:1025 length:303 start_codon:yes stop_codon:yes gene_type:complete
LVELAKNLVYPKKLSLQITRQFATRFVFPPSPVIGWTYLGVSPLNISRQAQHIGINTSILEVCNLFYGLKNDPAYPAYREYWFLHSNLIKAVLFAHDGQD